MPRPIELTGRRFERLIVLSRNTTTAKHTHQWICRCDCGTVKSVPGSTLLAGKCRSCGCLRRENTTRMKRTHGLTKTKTHNCWLEMRRRCYDPSRKSYKDYGGRGITVCDRWRDDFMAFLSDMGECPDGMSIDRIDVNGPYAPENCRWADAETQKNNRRDSHHLTIGSETATIAQWARKTGIYDSLILSRLQRGWTPAKAVSVPALGYGQWSLKAGSRAG